MNNAFAELENLLEAESEALRRGDFDALAILAPKKEAAWTRAQHSTNGSDALPTLHTLQAQARRNAQLLVAAQKGLSDAALKTRQAQAQKGALSTYHADGSKSDLSRPSGAHNLKS